MHKSALNAEVEHHLRMQEMERNRYLVAETKTARPGFLSRVLALLTKKGRGRPTPMPGGQELEAVEPLREEFVG